MLAFPSFRTLIHLCSVLCLQLEVQSWFHIIIPFVIVIMSVCIVDYYIESVAVNHLQASRVALYSTAAMFGGALLLSYTWNHPYMARVTSLHKLEDVITEDHVLSGGVIFSVLVFMLGELFFCLTFRLGVVGLVGVVFRNAGFVRQLCNKFGGGGGRERR